MASSLRRQVDALRHASSGTSSGYIQRKKGKPSLLLTPDQAAEVDLSSVRETAVMGLQRLEAVDQDFSPFQDTLFSKEAEGTLRDLQTKESNDRIDKSISAFLALLSPHFSCREAHFCLEYLIRHYKVYQYNVDAVVECCLPWHDTVAFARMVQLLSLKGSRWEFLTPVQKTGSPLPREAIARRCARDFGLLRFLCVSARRAAARAASCSVSAAQSTSMSSVSAATAAGRAKLFSFYAATVVEALASLGTTSDPLLRALVPTVVHGLSATKSPEYQMASYMILSALSGKGPLSPDVTGQALTALVCKPCQGGLEPSLLCALAVAQTQVGFSSKKDPSNPSAAAPLLLPTAAFEKLSAMEPLAGVLAGLAQKFDATAFLWLLLQSYVQHLPDQDSRHGESLTRLCTYPYWPSHSLPRLMRRLVDRLIRSYLALTLEGAEDEAAMEVDDPPEKSRRSAAMKTESRTVLRVLSQRYPEEVDAAVAKISRSVAKAKVATAKAALQEDDEGTDAVGSITAKREAHLKEEALSSLLVSTFAGAQLAPHLPLQQQEQDAATVGEEGREDGAVLHGSLIVALEHSSTAVRARAVEQLSRAISSAVESDGAAAGESASTSAGGPEDLSPVLLRRLHDEDPDVVLAITESDILVQQVLLRPRSSSRMAHDSTGGHGVGVADDSDVVDRAAVVASAAMTAAGPWLSAFSEARPKHNVASAGRVLCGLVRLASAASSACGEGGSAGVKQARDSALSLLLECLPGPHATARVKSAQRQAVGVGDRWDGPTEESATDPAAAAAATGKACKKASRAVGRAAIEAVRRMGVGLEGDALAGLFAVVGKVLGKPDDEGSGTGSAAKSPGKNKSKRKKSGDGDDLESEGVKSKGLKVMGEEVCDALAAAVVGPGDLDSKNRQLQALRETCGAGGRWLILECTYRALNLASASSSSGGNAKARAAAAAAASSLSSLLASLAASELGLRPHLLSVGPDGDDDKGVGAVGGADLLRYLRACAAHLPRPERSSSLFAEDHLAASAATPFVGGDGVAVTPAPLLGDVLVSVLTATAEGGSKGGASAVWEAVSAVVLHGYERRPLPALAAVAICGATVAGKRGRGVAARQQPRRDRGVDEAKVVAAARALCVAATFVRAAAEAAAAGDTVEEGDSSEVTERDIVGVFPAAVLAVASDDEGLRDSGLLFITTVSAHGDALSAESTSSSSSGASTRGAKKSKPTPSPGLKVEDSEFLPLGQMGNGADEPSPLNAPSLSSLVELATALAGKNRESVLDAGELTRHLATFLGEAAGGGWQEDVSRYLVAWAARLGWRNPTASALLLECLVWAKTPMRECCLPLLRCCLDSEQARNHPDNKRLLKILLGVTLNRSVGDATVAAVAAAEREESSKNTKSPKKTTRGNKGKDEASAAEDSPSSASLTIFSSVEAEQLMHRALRTPGPAQTHALNCLCATTSASSCGVVAQPAGEDQSTRQRRDLVSALVEAGLAGADGSLVAAAARALPCVPGDIAALLDGLPPLSDDVAGPSTSSKGRKKKSSATFKADAAITGTRWVFTLGGLVELVQALCGPSSPSPTVPNQQQQSQSRPTKGVGDGRGAATAGATTSAEGWGWAGPLAVARPLFDVLPSLLVVVTKGAAEEGGSSPAAVSGDDVVDAAEYGLWLTMDVLGGVLRRWGKGGVGGGGGSAAAEKLYEGRRAGDDAEMVLACVRENPSPQTRNSALALLSRMATLFPAQMASRLRSLLDAVCAAAAGVDGLSSGEGGGARAALRQTQKTVQSVVPALKAHGSEAGVGAHFVVQVFVEALDDAPAHARRALFSTLVDSLGEESLTIMSALLLRRAVSAGGPDVGGKAADEETTSALIEFVHQTIHRSRARGQVRTLVGLVQACHRLSVSAAKRSGSLSRQALDETVECFVEDSAADKEGEDRSKTDFLQLPLEQQEPARNRKASSPAFMTMDLRALCDEDSKHDSEKEGGMTGNFLELVLSFVRDHLVSRPLVMAVAAAAERGADGKDLSEDEGIQEGFLVLCEELLLFLRTLSVCGRGSMGGSGDEPAWSSVQGLAYAVFETLQSLLSVPSFVAVTQELLQHQDPHLRRKALRMFTRRLDPAEGGGSGGPPRLSPGEESLFVEMVPSLRLVAMGKRSVGGAGEDNDDMGEGIEEVMGPSSPEVGGGGRPDAMEQDSDSDGMKESAVNRQTALLSLDVLARVLGRRHKGAFEGVLGDVTEIVAGVGPGALPAVGQPGSDGILPLRASAFLLVATLCAVLGVRAFPRLPRFFPAMLEALEFQRPSTAAVTEGAAGVGGRGGGTSLLWTSALSAVATVAASLPSFLSPYLGRILAVALRPASAGADSSGGTCAAGSKQAADRVLALLATGVEARLLVPAVCGAYAGCVESVNAGEGVGAAGRSVARLLAYVQEIVAGLEKEAASATLPQFTRLLTQALDFRRCHACGSTPQVRESAALVETEASSALVGLVMRLSEVELRPLFLHLCEWKAGVSSGEGDRKATLGALDRRLSFYRVLDGLAGALKSIFTPYFAHVLTDCCDDMEAASLLTSVSASGSPATAKKKRKRAREEASSKRKRRKTLSSGDASDSDEESGEDDGEGEDTPELRWRRSAASRLVLSALRRCFQSDRSGFVNKARFELVLPAVVAQLECGSDFSAAAAGGGAEDEVSSCRLHAEELVGPCLAQLASASGKDALWKALANAVLMKTRSRRAGVRVAALVSLRQCFEVVGEEFLALLPECLPFLSELLEDGHPEVESECRALVKYIEGVLGESIESYLV